METTKVSFTAKDVMQLRQKTGQGMMDCKKALTECGGDMAKAEEWLREKLKGKMDTRTERTTGEGRVAVAIDGARGAIVEIRTESDFAAKNDSFVSMVADIARLSLDLPAGPIEPTDEMTHRIDDVRITIQENINLARGERLEGGVFGSYVHHDGKRACLLQLDGAADEGFLKGLCQHIVALDPQGISEDDVPAETVAQIRQDAINEAKESGKPAEIAGKIAEGKVRKHLQESTLLHQKFVLDESKTVKELLPSGVTVKRFIRYTLGS